MAQSQHNQQPDATTTPSAAAQANEHEQVAWRPEAWAERTIRRTQPLVEVGFGAQLMRRFDATQAPGAEAATLAQRFMADTLQPSATDLVLALYAPPQRHVRAARNGALSWSGAGPAAFPMVARTVEPPMLPAGTHVPAGSEPLLSDLDALGWGRQGTNTRSGTEQATHAAPIPAAAAAGRLPGVDLPAVHGSEPTLRAAVDDHERSLLPERREQRWAARSSEAQPEAAAAAPSLQTAATRPTGLMGALPINPLQRMGIRQEEATSVPVLDEQHGVPAPAPSGQSLVAPARSARTPAAALDIPAGATAGRWPDTPAPVPTAGDDQGRSTVAASDTNRAAATTSHTVGSTPASPPMSSAAEHAVPALELSDTSAEAAAVSRTTAEQGSTMLAQHEDILLAARPFSEARSAAPTASVEGNVSPLSRSLVPNNDAQTALRRQPDAHGTDTASMEAPTSSRASEGTAGDEADVNRITTVHFGAKQHNADQATRPQVSISPASLAQRTLLPLAPILLQRHLFNAADAFTTMPLLRTWRPSGTPVLGTAAFAAEGASPEAAAAAPLAQQQAARMLGSAEMRPPAQGTVPSLARSAIVPPFPLPTPVETPTSVAWEHHQRTQGAALLPMSAQPAASEEQASISAGLPASTVGKTILPGATPFQHQPDQADGEGQGGAVLRSFEPSFSVVLRDADTQPSEVWGALPLLQRVLAPHTLTHAATTARAAMAPTRDSSPSDMWPREIDHTTSASTQQGRSSASGALPLLQRAVPAAPRSEGGTWERHAQPLGAAWTMGMLAQRDGSGVASSNRAFDDRPAPPLTLLQPTAAGASSDGRESGNGSVAAPGDRNIIHGAGETNAHAAQQATPDLEALARQVYARLRRRLVVERERLGR